MKSGFCFYRMIEIGFLLLSAGLLAQGSPNVTLLKNLDSYAVGYNDCWGYVAPDGREYALLGVKNGTSIVDITDGPNAREVAFIASAFSSWKDIKTYQQYAYTVTEAGGTLQIIDLSNLPAGASLAGSFEMGFGPHNIYIDEAAGILYGADDFHTNHSVHVFSLADPLNPVALTAFGPDCHDMYARNGLLFIAEGVNDSWSIYDVSNPLSPQLLQRIFIPASGYVHNVWSNADNTYVMSTEETFGKTVKLWDIRDPNNVTMTDEYLGPNSLAHNAHIKGNYAYISHYGAGLRIVDISDPANIFEAGFYDTPDAWGAWPFFPSGKVIISDITGGLYVVFFEGAVESQSVSQSVNAGWNLIGLPLLPDDTTVTALFPNATPNTLFSYNGTYVSETALSAGVGYWLNFPAAETVPLAGSTLDSLTLNLQAGWNLIAGGSCDVPLAAIDDPGGIIIPGTLFGFEGTYMTADTLRRGRAYWINAAAAGTVTTNCSSSLSRRAAPVAAASVPAGFYALHFEATDPAGAPERRQTLYFGGPAGAPVDVRRFSLPPLPPSGAFDVRFSNDARLAAGEIADIRLQAPGHTVRLRLTAPAADAAPLLLQEVRGGELVRTHRLDAGGMMVFDAGASKMLRLRMAGHLPGTFAVRQNYPNPFNPQTTLSYHLPESAAVEVTVFNTLGQTVRTLFRGRQPAGAHSLTWSGDNDAGQPVASGVYLYRVTINQGSEAPSGITRQMLLMR